jgi:ADP-ribosylglycohydrolase
MLGAITGDIIGSIYERKNIKTTEFELFSPRCCFTDDSVLTIALADVILNDRNYADVMREYYRRYPKAGYGGMFHQWAKHPNAEAYNSWGNGAAMRISPVGYAFDTLEEVLKKAVKYTEITHNHPEGIKGACATASAIFLARTGHCKQDIKNYIVTNFGYDLERTCDDIRPTYRFNASSQGTVPEAIVAFLDATDFEHAIRLAVSLGGDCDTLTCITGGIAQAFYGGVPSEIAEKSLSILDEQLRAVMVEFMNKYFYETKQVEKNMTLETTDEMYEIESDGADETEDEVFVPQNQNNDFSKNAIFTKSGDPEIQSLYHKVKDGDLILQADFQRQYVWDEKKASKLIESAILQIPLPIIYISEEKDGLEYVIDGQQRLTSFFSFMDGRFPDGKEFKLSGLKVRSDLNGKKFSELPKELQKEIRCYIIRVITFQKDSGDDLKFDIFERLNTGSVQLNDQELRNCLYRGKFNQALIEMAKEPDFMYICGLKAPDKRMRDVELVLRFCAFYHETYLNYKSPIRSFLNKEAEKQRNISDNELAELKKAFKNSCQIIRSIFDVNSFKRFRNGSGSSPNGYWEPKKFNTSLFDILMWSFAREDKNKVFQNLDAIKEGLIYLMTEDQDFINSIELSTSSVQAVTIRFDKWIVVLRNILGVQQKEPRCFTLKLKEELMEKNPTCAICNQRIQSIDDSAVDHIVQYWTGGKTIPENARLTHRYCNWSRPRKENV